MKQSNQRGSIYVVVTICLVIALVFALGWIFWQNFIQKTAVQKDTDIVTVDKSPTPAKSGAASPVYTQADAMAGINSAMASKACGGSGATVNPSDFETVDATSPFDYQGGKNAITKDLTYAYVQYGCSGGNGDTGVLKRNGTNWSFIYVDEASIYPLCSEISGASIPQYLLDKCYQNSNSTEPTQI